MDEKWFDDQLNECFEKGLSPNQFGRLMYHAGCAAQAVADRDAAENALYGMGKIHGKIYFGDAVPVVQLALAAAAIVESK